MTDNFLFTLRSSWEMSGKAFLIRTVIAEKKEEEKMKPEHENAMVTQE